MKSLAPHLVLAVCSLGFAAVAGGGRRALSPRTVDGGDSGTNLDLGGTTVGDVGCADEAETSSAGKTDLPTQSGPDVGSAPDVGVEALPCTPAPAEPKNGGAVETVWAVSSCWVVDLAVNACNIYWTVVNPPEIYARAK